MQLIKLKDIEQEYRGRVQKILDCDETMNVDTLMQISVDLFHELKVKGIPTDDGDSDMLLCQYGVYNWGGTEGEHFSFDITRQFIHPKHDEPYQLSITLIFEPDAFRECKKYNCWSADFEDLDKCVEHIKSTTGYKLAKDVKIRSYSIRYDEV